jgi:hypothetical protein
MLCATLSAARELPGKPSEANSSPQAAARGRRKINARAMLFDESEVMALIEESRV